MRARYRVFAGVLIAACGHVKDEPPLASCTPDELVGCDGTVAQLCNPAGDGTIALECGPPGCNERFGHCNQCVPGTVTCEADGIVRCGVDGLPDMLAQCSHGCVEAPAPHCAYLEPSYAALADVCDEVATMPALDIKANQILDTSSDLICTGGVIPQTVGPSICVLRFRAISVQPWRTLAFTGKRAVALVADTAITVHGTIDVSANGSINGPGGGTSLSGGRAIDAIGGGGAGFRTDGGHGGSAVQDGGGANGGSASINPADLIALVGGPRPSYLASGAASGGAGGALALIACRGSVTISSTGLIDAGGGGGYGGFDTIEGPFVELTSAAGGGAGGNVVLEGLQVSVTGQLYANGGAGGGGTSAGDPAAGKPGQDGERSTMPAEGGAAYSLGGDGGAGGSGSTPPQDGRMPSDVHGTPGGGGGSAGFLQTYTPMGVTPTLTPSAISPLFQPNRTVRLR